VIIWPRRKENKREATTTTTTSTAIYEKKEIGHQTLSRCEVQKKLKQPPNSLLIFKLNLALSSLGDETLWLLLL